MHLEVVARPDDQGGHEGALLAGGRALAHVHEVPRLALLAEAVHLLRDDAPHVRPVHAEERYRQHVILQDHEPLSACCIGRTPGLNVRHLAASVPPGTFLILAFEESVELLLDETIALAILCHDHLLIPRGRVPEGLVSNVALPIVDYLLLKVLSAFGPGQVCPHEVLGDHTIGVARVERREVPAKRAQAGALDVVAALGAAVAGQVDDTQAAPWHLREHRRWPAACILHSLPQALARQSPHGVRQEPLTLRPAALLHQLRGHRRHARHRGRAAPRACGPMLRPGKAQRCGHLGQALNWAATLAPPDEDLGVDVAALVLLQ
mmetsp:Transcript_117553/g.379375  ORF Transcript_117553/g.379375 Transcript_117553/m.379375 type:complete len:321 (-) Transcript_117553:131-1093(-)